LVQKKGKLELADRGTLFLDEIGELALGLQAKLLRVLQEREFERVGGTRVLRTDVRVIAATNRNLQEATKIGTFRSDLYYRLNVLTIILPPLRERSEDIPLLAGHFAAKFARKCKRRVAGLTPEALACMMRYSWPGNVRELENAIERAVVIGTTELICPEDLPEEIVESQSATGLPSTSTRTYHQGVREARKQLIMQAVTAARGKYTEAARLLGVHPNYLHMLIRNLDLKETLKK
jgi:transcriptional regulator with PAS, ATPase and Fis domain